MIGFRWIVFDHDESNRTPRQFAGHTPPDAAGTADNVMILQTADVALHFSPAQQFSELEF